MATTDSAERSGRLSRARILEIALEHFAIHGYRGSSLARIAAEVGISQPGLLHHFPNKAALLMAVLAERDVQDLHATGTDPETLSEMDFAELIAFLVRIARHNVQNRDLVQLAHLTAAEATGSEHPAREWVVGRQKFLQSMIESSLRRGVEDGSVRSDVDPRLTTLVLVAAMEGLENQWLVDDEVDMVGSFVQFAEQLQRAVAPTD
ncbi:TetR/AcrR family transcriptional regulator [Rhodococcus maanshanensis]|uniref:DNA-binding transcriptional regulator, AcrR family n=1 Tax=Rhodococcus maanshanensis TaxID=183556 RepID=A0A1H7PFE4_9NOCA|nr:TetR/AcrR family transcriptional regulator [Rhodococcus maanshanensis]SEL34510.1 DNA-binding transcriptional regulator, AcrR family [Rhodococcus maanshanensis]